MDVGHVIDDDVEVAVGLQQGDQFPEPGRPGQQKQGNPERLGAGEDRRHQGAAEPVAGGVDRGREPHPVKAVLLRPHAEVVGGGRVFRVDSADGHELAGVAAHRVGDVAVVPAVMDDLDQHRPVDAVVGHLPKQHLRGAILLGWTGVLRRPGKFRIVDPYMGMGVDYQVVTSSSETARKEKGAALVGAVAPGLAQRYLRRLALHGNRCSIKAAKAAASGEVVFLSR